MESKGHIQTYLEMIAGMLKQSHPGRQSVEGYILREGHLFPSIPLTEEEREFIQRAKVIWQRHKVGQCYANAQSLYLATIFQREMEVTYVEGYVVAETQIPIYHAWLSLNGKVVDTTLGPTITLKSGRRRRVNRVFGDIPQGWEYWGVPLTEADVSHIILEHGVHAPVIDDFQCRFPKFNQ